jgi:Fe2+ or Zn2+ uptake regulation protein
MSGEATSKYHRTWPPAETAAPQAPAEPGPEARPPAESAALRTALRDRGMRVTPQRLAVHSALHDLGRHSTAEEVLERVHGTVPGVSLPTVYAALELLTDLGLALRVHAGRAVRFDPRSEAHHHLVCTSCGAVTDLDADVELGPALERARALGAQTSGAEVVVRGLCAACAAA